MSIKGNIFDSPLIDPCRVERVWVTVRLPYHMVESMGKDEALDFVKRDAAQSIARELLNMSALKIVRVEKNDFSQETLFALELKIVKDRK
jgi:hypothetical protein